MNKELVRVNECANREHGRDMGLPKDVRTSKNIARPRAQRRMGQESGTIFQTENLTLKKTKGFKGRGESQQA